jgi:hypothetical protein
VRVKDTARVPISPGFVPKPQRVVSRQVAGGWRV